MALGNPILILKADTRAMMQEPAFGSLSPATQQQLIQFAESSEGGLPQTPEFQAAIQEASQAGLTSSINKVKFALALAAMGGLAAIPALAGAGAAAGSGAGAAGASATPGITSAGMAAAMPGSMATVGAGGVSAGGAGMAAAQGGGGILSSLGKYGEIAGDVGPVLGGAASGMAQGRRADAALNNDAIARNNQAGLSAAQYNRDLPSVRTGQVSRGEVLNTMQNAPMTGDARIDKFSGGGLRPSAFGPQSRQAGAELSRQALGALMSPETDRFTPERIEPTSGGTVENIMGGVGIGADIFSLLQKYGRR